MPVPKRVPTNVTKRRAKTRVANRRAKVVASAPSDSSIAIPPKRTKRVRKTSAAEPIVAASAVVLPATMSPRVVSKAEAWRAFFEVDLPPLMYNISYTSAVAFLLVGTTLCVSSFFGYSAGQQATVLNSLATTSTNIGTVPLPVTTVPNTTAAPTVTLLDPFPEQLTEDKRFAVMVTDAATIQIVGESVDTGSRHEFVVEPVGGTSYRFTIPASNLQPGSYIVRATVRTNTAGQIVKLGAFNVPDKLPPPVTAPPVVRESVSEVATSTKQNTPALPNLATPTTPDSEASTTTASVTSSEEIEVVSPELPVVTPEQNETETQTFAIRTATTLVSGWVPVYISAPDTFTAIELYIRPERSLSERYLGAASKSGNRWFYSFSTTNLPSGTYQVTARAKTITAVQTSNTWTFTVRHDEPTDVPKTTSVGSTSTSPVYAIESVSDHSTSENEEVLQTANRTLVIEQAAITDLLQRYTSTLKTDDETLKAQIDREFNDKKIDIVSSLLSNPDTKDMAPALEIEIEARLNELKERARAFEIIRTERADVVTDADGDGISDDDELNIYGTSPSNPDTDNDGYLDGIEIIRGFNPKDPSAEAVVRYELPTEIVGLERADVLRVNAVAPIIDASQEGRPAVVTAEISGRGLPQSYVTIYIFSTPTIVTVKTDADGSFVYRFDKELEDGNHEVYVAFTDNTGAILAKSEPFTFVKQAEAFTPTNESGLAVESLETVPGAVAQQSYQLVFGLIIISLGLLLLLLGVSIKPRPEPLTVSQ